MANYALRFDQSSGKGVTVPNISAYNIGTGDFCIEFWFRYSDATTRQFFFDKSFSTTRVLIGNQENQGPSLNIADSWIINGGTGYADGWWHHIAAVREGTGTDETILYIDGTSVGTATNATNITSSDDFALGNRFDLAAFPMDGDIDEVRFWNISRSSTEINDNKDQEISAATSGLIGYWKCNTGSGLSLVDSHANANHGTLTSTSPTWITPGFPYYYEPQVKSALSLPYVINGPTFSPYQVYPGTVGLALAIQTPTFSPLQTYPGALSLALTPNVPTAEADLNMSGALALSLSMLANTYDSGKFVASALSLPISYQRPTWYWEGDGVTIYRLILTGTADATTDVELPMSTCNIRLQDGDPTYVQVTVPAANTYSTAVQARPNGELIVYRGIILPNGEEQLAEIARSDFDTLSDDRGSTGNTTLTLSGTKTTTTLTPKERTMSGLNYRRSGTASRRYRCSIDTHLKPGDTAIFPEFGDETITVGSIVINVSRQGEFMEIEEATA